jgi:hypothetical protein
MKLAKPLKFNRSKHGSQIQVQLNEKAQRLCQDFQVFPLKEIVQGNRRVLILAMRDVSNLDAIQAFEFLNNCQVLRVEADYADIQWLFQKHFLQNNFQFFDELDPSEVTQDLFEQLEITSKIHLMSA